MSRKFAVFPEVLGREPYTILIYMLFPLIGAFFLEGMERMFSLLLLVPFLFVYRQSYWRDTYLVFVIVQAIIIGFWVYMFGPMFFLAECLLFKYDFVTVRTQAHRWRSASIYWLG